MKDGNDSKSRDGSRSYVKEKFKRNAVVAEEVVKDQDSKGERKTCRQIERETDRVRGGLFFVPFLFYCL